ncbi:MAG: hypothetical protein HY762_03695 [Planctomycetes bacterium]|nr:hypothetical protein [Planctomycetota bacterium]
MSDRIKPLSIKTEHIAPKAVTTAKLGDKSVTTGKIEDGAVTPEKMSVTPSGRPLNPPVAAAEIADNGVTTNKLQATSVNAEKIAPNAVTTEKIANGAVTRDKIRDGSITREKVADGTVGTAELVDGAVTTSKLGAGSVTAEKLAANSVGGAEIKDGAVAERELSSASVTPVKLSAVDAPADGETPTYNQAQAKFEWKPAAGLSRPISPPLDTPEIGDGKVTPAKLSFVPVSRPLTPPATPSEMEDRFTINQNLLLFSNLSNASVPNTEIDLSPYVPVGTKYAMVVMTHAGASSITYGYKAQFYTKPTVDPAPLYRLDTAVKDFTNYLTVLIPLDTNRKFVTSVYRDGVTTAAELYLMGYIR